MQNKYLISRQNKHFRVKTLATNAPADGADIKYQDFAMDDVRENIITCWLFLSKSSKEQQQTFIKHLQLDDALTLPEPWMHISFWFDNQPLNTRVTLRAFARNFSKPA